MKLKNEIGNKYGKWTVIGRAENRGTKAYWVCQCECGTIKEISGTSLRNGTSTSCGCSKRKDYTNERFGKLTAIKFHHIENNKTFWLFKCDCGNYIVGRIDEAVAGDLTSCQQCLSNRIIDEVGHKYGKLTVVSFVGINNKGQALWKCQCECGNTCIKVGSILRSGCCNSCGCLISKGEWTIQQFLQQQNILFQTQYSFQDLKSEKGYLLRYDFAITDKDNNVIGLIEFDGIQHYYESGEKWGQSLEYTQMHDKIKNDYSQSHNIPLLRIKYNDSNIINKLKTFISTLYE